MIQTTADGNDRELIARLTKSALDEQIDATVANEAKLLEEFSKVIAVKDVEVADAARIIEAYDKIWLPKAPILAISARWELHSNPIWGCPSQ